MKYLLDSNIISDFYDKYSEVNPKIFQKLESLSDEDHIYVSILTLFEFEYGWANAPEDKKFIIKQKIIEVQQDFEFLPLTFKGAEVYGLLKKAIKDSRLLNKETIKKYNIDLMVGATAIENNCILVSSDSIYEELKNIFSGLRIENWAK